MKLSIEYLKNMLDMRSKLLHCAQKDLEQALAELDQCEYILAQQESANNALKRQNDHFRQKYVDASSYANDMAIECGTMHDEIEMLKKVNVGLLEVINELKLQVDWWRQQDSDTAWLCSNNHQPCAARASSDDNTCMHYPPEHVVIEMPIIKAEKDTRLPHWAEVYEEDSE